MKVVTLIAPGRLAWRCSKMTLLLTFVLTLITSQTLSADNGSPHRLEIPGELFDIGDFRLHLYCQGEGQPVVIMDAGLGGSSYEWFTIQTALAEQVKACVYDRAGYGWSDPGPKPRTSGRIADELLLLVKAAGLQGPYVLVGHSFGGYNMQLFARRNPALAAALVLVDSSHEDQVERYLAPPLRVRLVPEVKKGHRNIVRLAQPKIHPQLPSQLKGIVYRLLSDAYTRRAISSEYVSFGQSADEVKAATELEDIPLFVITRGQRVWPDDEKGNRMEALWRELQTELALQSPRHAQIVATDSGHHVHLEQPQLVLKAIRNVIDVTKQPRGTALKDHASSVVQSPVFQQAEFCSYTF